MTMVDSNETTRIGWWVMMRRWWEGDGRWRWGHDGTMLMCFFCLGWSDSLASDHWRRINYNSCGALRVFDVLLLLLLLQQSYVWSEMICTKTKNIADSVRLYSDLFPRFVGWFLLAFGLVEVSEVLGLELEAEMRTYDNSKIPNGLVQHSHKLPQPFLSRMSGNIFRI